MIERELANTHEDTEADSQIVQLSWKNDAAAMLEMSLSAHADDIKGISARTSA